LKYIVYAGVVYQKVGIVSVLAVRLKT